jgi:hypothetical protein
MKLAQLFATLIAVAVIGVSAVVAAPVESIESGRAAARTKVEGFLSEKAVANQLASLGLTSAQVSARIAWLNDSQIERLAAQVDQIRAAGSIENDQTRWGAWDSFWHTIGTFFHNFFRLWFLWDNNTVIDQK